MKNNILIVEDEHSLLKALTDKFSEEGFVVMTAENGERGLAVCHGQKPDLILLDIVMPVMDGVTMMKKLKESDETKDIPVILLTNLSDSQKVEEAMKSGVSDYLIKADWKISDVVEKVKQKLI